MSTTSKTDGTTRRIRRRVSGEQIVQPLGLRALLERDVNGAGHAATEQSTMVVASVGTKLRAITRPLSSGTAVRVVA